MVEGVSKASAWPLASAPIPGTGTTSIPTPGGAIDVASFDSSGSIGSVYSVVRKLHPDIYNKDWTTKEKVSTAFAKGDTESLRVLLAADVFNDFAGTIRKREAAGEKMETTLVGFESVEIAEADLRGRIAEVTVRFVTDLISVTRDQAGAVVGGSASAIDRVTDLWTFARDVRSRDPNWTLIATSAPA